MTQLNSTSLREIFQEALKEDKDFIRVEKIVERLSPDLAFYKSTVSRLTQELDPQIKKWQEERLREH